MAVNESIAPASTILDDGDTVAFIPQVRICRCSSRPRPIPRAVSGRRGTSTMAPTNVADDAPEASEEPESRLMLETQETRNADVERPHVYAAVRRAPGRFPEPLADDEERRRWPRLTSPTIGAPAAKAASTHPQTKLRLEPRPASTAPKEARNLDQARHPHPQPHQGSAASQHDPGSQSTKLAHRQRRPHPRTLKRNYGWNRVLHRRHRRKPGIFATIHFAEFGRLCPSRCQVDGSGLSATLDVVRSNLNLHSLFPRRSTAPATVRRRR